MNAAIEQLEPTVDELDEDADDYFEPIPLRDRFLEAWTTAKRSVVGFFYDVQSYPSFHCRGCHKNTIGDEYYMVKGDVWRQVNPAIEGMLCVRCVEKRLGRLLRADDFTDAPINKLWASRKSARLRDRLRNEDDIQPYVRW